MMAEGERVVSGPEGAEREGAKTLMHRHRLERVLVVDGRFELKGLIPVKDILKSTEHPLASKDELGRLRVGAAVGTAGDTDERVEALVAAGVDAIVVDTPHGHPPGRPQHVRGVHKSYSTGAIIGGRDAPPR